VEVGAEFWVLLAVLGPTGVDSVQLGGDSHYAIDCGTEDREDGAFTGSDCLETVRGELLNHVAVQFSGCFWSRRKYPPERQEAVRAGPWGRGRVVLVGEGCWPSRWQPLGPDCLRGWEGPPSGDAVERQDKGRCPVSKAGCALE